MKIILSVVLEAVQDVFRKRIEFPLRDFWSLGERCSRGAIET